jgi:hypothetical protein
MFSIFRKKKIEEAESYQHMSTQQLEVMVLTEIRNAGKAGLTQDELLVMYPHLAYSSITARPAALKRKGLVVESGTYRRGRSGRHQRVLIDPKFKK